MKIQKKTVDASIERDMITAMIIDDVFLQKIQMIIRLELIQASYVKTIAQWCINYYQEFNTAPKETIQNIYESNLDQLEDQQADLILTFLTSISDDYSRQTFNSSFVLKEVEKYFKKQSLLELSQDIKADISQGKIEEAELKRIQFNQVVTPKTNVVDVFAPETVDNAFNSVKHQYLFKLPGALGQLIQPFRRYDFVALTAAMKFGKSFVLIDWAVRAMLAGCKVWFFSLEMSEEEVSLRYYQNLVGDKIQDLDSYESEYKDDKEVDIPFFDEDNDIEIRPTIKKGISQIKMNKKIKALKKRSKGGEIKICVEPSHSINTTDIEDKLAVERILKGYIPDVIIIDYADIMAPEKGAPKDVRHSINYTWVKLRALAQKYNCCVIVATQGNRKTFKKDFEQDDVSEEIRKIAHVTRFIALNKGVEAGEEDELAKEHSYRFNVLAQRSGYFNPEKFVRVLRCLAIGKPYLDSRWID